MHKWLMFVLFMAASLFGLVVLAQGLANAPGEEAAEEDGANTLKIVASNFQFDQAEYKVKKGEKLKVVLKNEQGVHGVEIPELGIKLEGSELSKEVTFDKPGTYELHCSVLCGEGHANMKSKLIVE